MNENDTLQANLGLVKSVVAQFNPKNPTEFDEFQQAGLIGLMKALRKYDESKGKLSTFAFYYIGGEIKSFIKQEKEAHICIGREPSYPAYASIDEYLDNLTEIEKKILDLHLQGYNFTEIAGSLNYSLTWICSVYHKMVDRIAIAND